MSTGNIAISLRQNLEKAKSYYDMLHALLIDYQLSEERYTPFFAVDFSEVFRYLHPKLDRTQVTDWSLYKMEQVALHILFDVNPEKLILLPPYVQEFRNHMGRIEEFYERLKKAQSKDEILNIMSEPAEPRVVSKAQELLGASGSTPEMSDLEKLFSSFTLLIDEDRRNEDLETAIDRFCAHAQTKIISLHMLEKVDTDVPYGREASPKDYFRLMVDMLEKRPGRLGSNERDSEAATMIKALNDKNSRHKKCFFLVSSSKLIRDALLNTRFRVKMKSGTYFIPILRDLNYVLLRFAFEDLGRIRAIKRINQYENQLRNYIALVHELENAVSERKIYLTSKAIEIYTELSDALWDLELLVEKLGPKTEVFERISSPQSWRKYVGQTVDLIMEFSSKPPVVRSKAQEVLDALKPQCERLDNIFSELSQGG